MTSTDDLRRWHQESLPLYRDLASYVAQTLGKILGQQRIPYVSISHRAKDTDSFMKKVTRKAYVDPKVQNTDFAGVRIITYLNADVESVTKIVDEAFEVLPHLSENKGEKLGDDRFGYLSVHRICQLGPSRVALPECTIFGQHTFEIQIRSALQHAWAEIEHDRRYKFAGILPTHLRRRLSLVAGLLELADREFDQIAASVDEYIADVTSRTTAGNLGDSLDSASFEVFAARISSVWGLRPTPGSKTDTEIHADLIRELSDFGCNSLSDVDEIVARNSSKIVRGDKTTVHGVLRSAMMIEDIDRYFSAWHGQFHAFKADAYHSLTSIYGKQKIDAICATYDIKVVNQPPDYEP